MVLDSMTADHGGGGKRRVRVPIPDPHVGTRWVEKEVADEEVQVTEGKITCAKCGSDAVLMQGDYLFGVGFDCSECSRKDDK